MTSLNSLANRLPLTLTLSPKGRGKRGLAGLGQATGVAFADASGGGHALPMGEKAGVRGYQPC